MISIFSLLMLLVSNACISGFQEEADSKTIKISKDSFSKIYPAVWFSPSDGTTTPLVDKSEAPPKPNFKIWIEPRDPEITTMDPKAAKEGRQGFQLIGHGKPIFIDPVLPKEKRLTDEIKGADLDEPLAVFLYVEGEKSYAMLIESFSKEKQELTFQWKTLGAK